MKKRMRLLPIIVASIAIVASSAIAVLGTLSSLNILQLSNENLTYKCKFKNQDGSLLYSCNVKPNTVVKYKGPTPTIPENNLYLFTFDGWDKQLSIVNEDTTFTATYKSVKKECKVDYQNYDGTLLYTTFVEAGTAVYYGGEIPQREPQFGYSYNFVGWDKSEINILTDTVLIAQFEEVLIDHIVDFVNYDGEVLYHSEVPYGGTAIYKGKDPTPPESDKKGYEYVFSGWDKPTTPILKDTDIYAEYELIPKEYVVTFKNYDNTVLDVEKVEAGSGAIYNGSTPLKPTDEYGRYVFIGWDLPLDSIYEDTEVYAQYSSFSSICHVRFLNYDESLLEEKDVDFGESVLYEGKDPVRESDEVFDYEFIGWDRKLDEVTENFATIAQFERYQKKYKVTYKNYDDSVLLEQDVKAGEKSTYPLANPTRPQDEHYSYVFKCWNIDPEKILCDTEICAIFEAIPLEKGKGDEEGAGGSGTGTGGDGQGHGTGGGGGGSGGSGDAQFASVIFENYNGEILDADMVYIGKNAYYDGLTPQRENNETYSNYYFHSFDKTTENVRADFITYAQYCVTMDYYDLYIISFRNDDGSLLYEDYCEYGEIPNYEPKTIPVSSKQSDNKKYAFVGWDKSLTAVKGCYTLYAQYELLSSSLGGKVIGGGVSTSAPEFGESKTIFEYQTSFKGSIHLRDKSFGDYALNNWGTPKEYFTSDVGEISPLYLTTDLIENSDYFSEIKMTYYKGEVLEHALLPMYSSTYLETNGSDLHCLTDLSEKIDYEFYPIELSEDTASFISSSHFSSKAIEDEEDKYSKYVRENYLNVSETHKKFFDDIIQKNNLSVNSIKDIIEVKDYIKNSAKYNLEFEDYPADQDAIIYFLSTAKEGICNHFASALTLLYRTLGLPARFTVGYVANSDGSGEKIAVTNKDAHAWTEIYLDGVGWVCVDGTAPMNGSVEGGEGEQGEGGESDEDPVLKLTIMPQAENKVYDGKPMDLHYFINKNILEEGETIQVFADDSKVNVGHYESTAIIKILDKNGNDITSKYSGRIHAEIYEYEILPREITITTGSAQKAFDGEPLTCDEFSITGNLAENDKVVFKGSSITNIGTCSNMPQFNEFMIWNQLTQSSSTSNYIITWEYGTLKVTK